MKYLLLLVLLTSSLFCSQTVHIGNLTFHTDEEKPVLAANEQAVFPYSDEALVLLQLATKIKEQHGMFSLIVDPFCGDGKSGIPLIDHCIAEKLIGCDLNLRAIHYAEENALLNHLEKSCCFFVRNILTEGLPPSIAPGKTLWIANPPFALKAKGASLETMRDGGENGLQLTLAFATKAFNAATTGDVILGIGYSRITPTGTIELEEELKKIVSGVSLKMILLENEKLWRGFNGKKEQNNPMPISEQIFALKANPDNPEEVQTYKIAALAHLHAGYNQLGYFAYILEKQ